MIRYICKRLLLMVPTLFGVLLMAFVVVQFVPGGPVEQLLHELKGRGSSEAAGGGGGGLYQGQKGLDADQLAQLRAQFGFDQPAPVRFWIMLKRYATFDLGESYYHHQSVWALLIDKLPVSISLGMWTFVLTYLVSIPLGVAKAMRHGSRFDLVSTLVLLVGYAIPGFVLGVALLVLFGGGSFWQLFPLRGLTSDDWDSLSLLGKLTDYLWHLVLPVSSMVIGGFATVTLLTKNSLLEEIRKQYVLTARAKGLKEHRILYRHVFRNAVIPIITGFPAAFVGAFFTGSLLIETLFSLDGLGLLSFESVMRRDYPVVLGSLFVFSLIGLLTKLVSDLCYVLVDPRVRFEGAAR
ncbi:ABC transporter permease subunit [Chitiniphilus purpureus]|uniref:ABC transporter permease subunit n=1 Tax=Chitiniphilus purpureus TaxID=2981137 RepID=A0ABY6DTF2_9NEIS|nr:ABC transporter permease subunit [Chitiniphilus sp. CD1]UXY16766.1 ABC transporter permease subunit [Chitiniphilus sp. CD1]